MGQAKLRGTPEQRQAEALEVIRRDQAERDRAEMEEAREVARQWAAMSPEERERRMEAAKAEARTYGELAGIFGHDAAMALSFMGKGS